MSSFRSYAWEDAHILELPCKPNGPLGPSISDLEGTFRASLVAQMINNLLAMWEIRIQFLGQEDPWRREWPPTPVFLPGESHGQRSLATVHGVAKESDMTD